MFIDRVTIVVISGKGGDGCVAFRREKHVPRGGPSGGDGGKGGDVIVEVDPNLTTLLDFYYTHTYRAKAGRPGQGANKTGANAEDVVIKVPPGTVLTDNKTGETIADLVHGDVKVVRGGRGGLGNARFATPSNQAPRRSTPGKAGEERELVLELKFIADVGLVGAPNSGKSTLLSRITRARPRIANYPFTTIEPNLGIVESHRGRRFVVCDIPGLIEGAHEGKGLGLAFLRHIERTSLLLLLVDLTDNPAGKLDMLEKELETHADGVLAGRPRIVVGTKLDAAERKNNWLDILGEDAILISSVTGEGLHGLLDLLSRRLAAIEEGPI